MPYQLLDQPCINFTQIFIFRTFLVIFFTLLFVKSESFNCSNNFSCPNGGNGKRSQDGNILYPPCHKQHISVTSEILLAPKTLNTSVFPVSVSFKVS